MRPHVDAASGWESGWSHVIEKDERADQLARGRGEHATDSEAAEVSWTGIDHAGELRSSRAGRRRGLDIGKYAHASILRRQVGKDYRWYAAVKAAD